MQSETPSQPPEAPLSAQMTWQDVHRSWQRMRSSVTFKLFSMMFLFLFSLIPVAFIQDLVREREGLQRSASEEVNRKWADPQTLTGPILTLPYRKEIPLEKGKVRTITEYLHILPQKLDIQGSLSPEKLHRGIYTLTVYTSDLQLKGHFNAAQFKNLPIAEDQILWQQAFVSTGISDLRGIKETVKLQWGPQSHAFDPGTVTDHLYTSGIHTPVGLSVAQRQKQLNFQIQLKLKGTQKLFFVPVGQETQVKLKAPWPDPSFDGAFLPDSRSISPEAFQANWKVLHLNRNFPQLWQGKQYSFENAAFGVWLIQPHNHYQKVTRSVKYALFFIGLTFLTFFFVEILTGRLVHPLQYLLVGFALCVFYTLLLSISEILGFEKAYATAASMTLLLISAYASGFLKSWPLTAVTGGVLSALYGFIYVIIEQQDYALLMGSLGLFMVLALVMFFSRRLSLEPESGERRT
ncbi:MAG: cell envelope integrity protein CreD [Candidatus Sericytochromatia bacterium]|nr:cell envelope integrity protein CreD [Candidatus Sericytochromatia bacterium]